MRAVIKGAAAKTECNTPLSGKLLRCLIPNSASKNGVRSMNPTYHMMGQQVTVASLASSSTAEALRSRPPTMHTAGAHYLRSQLVRYGSGYVGQGG